MLSGGSEEVEGLEMEIWGWRRSSWLELHRMDDVLGPHCLKG